MASLMSSAAVYIGATALNAVVPFFVLPLLARWLGPTAIGIVGNYLAVGNITTLLIGLCVYGIISVVHFRQDPCKVPAYVIGALRVLLLCSLMLSGAVVLVLCAPWLVSLVAGVPYALAVPLLQWLAQAAALSGMYYFGTNYLLYAGRAGLLSATTVSCPTLQLRQMALLVPRWGAEGVAASVLATPLVYCLSAWRAAHRVLPMPWSLRMQADKA